MASHSLRFIVLFLLGGFVSLQAADRWTAVYLHDRNDSELALTGLQFPTAQAGFASGAMTRRRAGNFIMSEREKRSGVILLTSDGGKTWSEVGIKEVPISLFFLDEITGWFITENGVYRSSDGGRSWKQTSKAEDLLEIFFLTKQHGFVVGSNQSALETNDGGVTWTPVGAATLPNLTKESTVYEDVTFRGETGMIAGWSRAAGRDDSSPAWLHPEWTTKRKYTADTTNILLQTRDGGRTWESTVQQLTGKLTRVHLTEAGFKLALFDFQSSSDVYRIDDAKKEGRRVFRKRNRVLTDLASSNSSVAYLAGYEPPGDARPSPIPGKVKILKSSDLENWDEIPVDYRAVARQVWLAVSGDNTVWAATDTGTILKLQSDQR